MKILGVTGKNGSGKDELIKYLNREYDVPSLSVGDIVRGIAEEEGVEKTRENLHDISEKCLSKYGRGYFITRIIDIIEREKWENVGITGIRTPSDVSILKGKYGNNFILIYVRVENPRIRYERIRERGEDRDKMEFKEFLRYDLEEDSQFNLRDTIRMADLNLDNSGSLNDFHRTIDHHVVKPFMMEVSTAKKK
ncbi:MAG: AAA family ATPase [candidate division Zixibacteria bacterium]|nr:AAA family ATPase [candidate division Zixibacteria bacterium]